MSAPTDEAGLLWRRLTAALAARGASAEAAATAREAAHFADAKLGTDLVGRFVEGYYLPRRYGGTPSLTDANAEALVAAVEALPVAAAKTEATTTATAAHEAMAVGLEDLHAEKEARAHADNAERRRLAEEKKRRRTEEQTRKDAARKVEEVRRQTEREQEAERARAAQTAKDVGKTKSHQRKTGTHSRIYRILQYLFLFVILVSGTQIYIVISNYAFYLLGVEIPPSALMQSLGFIFYLFGMLYTLTYLIVVGIFFKSVEPFELFRSSGEDWSKHDWYALWSLLVLNVAITTLFLRTDFMQTLAMIQNAWTQPQ